MHIPDGFLDIKTCVATAVASGVALSYCVKKSSELLDERQLPTLGIMSAFIFAAQMVNFPVAPGATGHLLGAALATILLGPWSASLVIATVLIVQGLFFQDGGIAALGANIFNMAVLGVAIAYFTRLALSKIGLNHYISTFAAAWLSVMGAALAASVELAVSGTVAFNVVYPPMAGWHTLIGIGEGIITSVILTFVSKHQTIGPKAENNLEVS